jgi:hypothetical protein
MMKRGLPTPSASLTGPSIAQDMGTSTKAPGDSEGTRRSVRDSLVVQAIATFGVFVALWRLLLGHTTLPASSYSASSMLARAIHWPYIWLFVTILALPLVLTWRRSGWSSVDASGRLRVFIFIVSIVFGWTFSTYNTNLYFGQEHTYDRLALIALTGLIWIHPSFFVLQLLAVLVIIGQLNYPLPESGWHYADKRLPLDALVLFVAFLQVRLFCRAAPRVYLYCLICLIGVVYGYPAILKLNFGPHPWSWVLHNNLSNLFVSAHTNGGWLAGVSDQFISAFARLLDSLRVPMAVGTVVVELSPLFMLLHPRVTRWVPVGLVGLHVLILVASGIFFWKWIVFQCGLLWYTRRVDQDLSRPRREWAGGIYRWRMVALAPVLMILAWRFLTLTPFVWGDTRVANFFVIRGIGQSGAAYRLDPRFFAPYDLTVQQSRFYFAFPEPVLAGTFGTTDRFELAERLERATVEDLAEIRQAFGRVYFDSAGAGTLRVFLERSVETAMIRNRRDHWLYRFAPPHHFQTTHSPNAYQLQEPLASITLTFQEWFWDGRRLQRTRDIQVADVPLATRRGSSR